jgi:hypothetical protein
MTDEERAALKKKMQERARQKEKNENIQVNPQVQPVNNPPVHNAGFKKFLVWGVVLVAICLMFDIFTYSSKNNTNNTVKSETATESASKEDEKSNLMNGYVIGTIHKNCKKIFGDNYKLDIQNDTYVIAVWFDGVSEDSANKDVDSWNDIKDKANTACKNILNGVTGAGIKDAHVNLNILDGTNHDTTLFSSHDGKTFFDVLDQNTDTNETQTTYKLDDIKAYGDYLQSFSFDDTTITAVRSSDGDKKLTEDDYKYFAIMKDVAKELSGMTLDYDIKNGDCRVIEKSLKDGSRQFVQARMTATNEAGTKYNTYARFELTKDGKLILHSLKADDSNLNYDDGTMLNGTHSK